MIAPGEKNATGPARRRWLLRYQILFPFTAVMLLAIASISALSAWLAARASGEETTARVRHVTATLAEANYPLTRPVLDQVKEFSGADFVLSAPDGTVIGSTLNSANTQIFDQLSASAKQSQRGTTVRIGSESFFHSAAPARPKSDRQPVVLHVLYPVRARYEAQWRAAAPPLYVGAFAVATAVAISLTIARRITRPIVQLKSEVDRLVEGGFQPVPLPSHDDELGDLVKSVNVLANRLKEYREAIQRSERLAALGQLSAGLAHQVRNAVAGARIALQLHQKQCTVVDPESLEVAMRQLRLSEDHLNCVLSAGQPQPPALEHVNVEELLKDVIALLQPTFRHRRVELKSDCWLEEAVLQIDANQVRQAMLNLILNAIEAAGAGGWVRIQGGGDASWLAISISDSGPGPPPELIETMFDPLATGKPFGVGLGLVVARQVAEAHGGRLQFTREQETKFELLLPRQSSSIKERKDQADLAVCT